MSYNLGKPNNREEKHSSAEAYYIRQMEKGNWKGYVPWKDLKPEAKKWWTDRMNDVKFS